MAKISVGFKKHLYTKKIKYLTMMGKIGLLGTLVFLGVLLVLFSAVTHTADSATFETGSTTMNVTVRGWVGINISNCITSGITFLSQDQSTSDNNASCNNITANGGSSYNLTRDSSSTVDINFSHTSNRSNLTTGTYTLDIGNVTYNANSTENNATNLYDTGSSEVLLIAWVGMETCGNVDENNPDCWAMYYLDVPAAQEPGNYYTGYCWCGRQQGTAEANCGSCT